MEPDLTIVIVSLILVLCSAGLTLVKAVFSIIHRNYEDGRDTTPILEKIHRQWDQSGFLETISSGRFFCNNLASILLFLAYYPGWLDRFGTTWGTLLSLSAVLSFVYLFALFLPNVIGNLRPYTLAKVTWAIMKSIGWIFRPTGAFSKWTSKQIFKLLGHDQRFQFLTDMQRNQLDSDTSHEEENSLEEDEKEMIRNIFEFGETPVKEIMTPRVNMVALDINASLDKVLETINSERHSRIPVYRENPDTIIGVLTNRDVLHWVSEHREKIGINASEQELIFPIDKLIKPPFFAPINKKIDDLMREMRRTRSQLAIVVDEYGGTAGLVTLEDILEEIVGEIHDEDDVPEDNVIQPLTDGYYVVDPVISIYDLQDELDFHFELDEVNGVESLSGLIHAVYGDIPNVGVRMDLHPLELKITKKNGTRIEKVKLRFKQTESKD